MKLKKLKKFLPALIFLIFIALIGLLFCFAPKSDYSSNEKRYLEDFPEFTFDTLISGEFGEDFETYLADHISGRDFFVGLNAYYDVASGRNGSKGVYLGSDDYLINDPVDEDNYLALNIEKLKSFSEKNDLNSTLMVVPSTGYIMGDKLPNNHYEYDDNKYYEIIKKNKGDLNFIDLRDTFEEKAEEDVKLYYKTDHHWTTEGAYIAYEEYCKALELNQTPISDFDIKSYDDFYGTTYSTSALWLTPSESIDVWYNKNYSDNISVEIVEDGEVKKSNSMYYLDHLEEDDKYPVFLDGNHSLVRIKNSESTGGKLLVIKDSFAHCFTPFLTDNYSEIIMIDMRYYKEDVSKLVEEENIKDTLMIYGLDNLSLDTDIRWLK